MSGMPEWETWRRGRRWARLGRYDRSFAAWKSISDSMVRPRMRASRAAALRELGLHEWAEAEDLGGLNEVDTEAPGDQITVAALRVGLVADAVGQGDAGEAAARLVAATAEVAELPPGPQGDGQRRRLGWVRLEVGLLTGQPVTVDLPVRHPAGKIVIPALYRHAGRHHLAKGLLFSGVAHRDRRALDVAARIAWPGLRWAIHLARADLGAPGALHSARAAWRGVVVPGELAEAVDATPAGHRIGPPCVEL